MERCDGFYDMSIASVIVGMSLYHDVRYEGLENIPERGPALLLPKHTYQRDILVEGMALLRGGRRGHWVMKGTLPAWMRRLGGIPVLRSQDGGSSSERRRMNMEALERVADVYRSGGIVVVHPEGGRYVGELGDLKPQFLKHAAKLGGEGISVPGIPVGIEYHRPPGPRSPITVRVGAQRSLGPDIPLEELADELRTLSGL